jgi:hypothetical protein
LFCSAHWLSCQRWTLSPPLPPGERCTSRIDIDVAAGRKDGKLSLRIRNPLGDRDSDNLKFK